MHPRIRPWKAAIIEKAYREGMLKYDAERDSKCCHYTIKRCFAALEAEGIPRGTPRPRKLPRPLRPRDRKVKYRGPVWIGTPC